MPTGTYELIQSQTTTSVSSVSFSSIPTTYTNLVLIGNTTSPSELMLRFNGDSGGNYYALEMWGPNGSDVYTQRTSGSAYLELRDSGTTLGTNPFMVNIQQYKNANVFKSVLIETNDDRYNRAYRRQGYWANTTAINSISVTSFSGSFSSGSTFSLYGIQGA